MRSSAAGDSRISSSAATGAAGLLGKKSLLIVVDTHIRSFIEFPELYNQAKRRVIIDHHRLTEPDDGSAEIFHHDPGASSTSEMVADMLEYIVPDINIPRPVAEALLAGIMLRYQILRYPCGRAYL